MRNYIILNGKNSNEINGLLIQELPPISKPLIRTEVEEIDGRDGDIVTPLGYSAYDKEFTIGLYKDFDVNEVAAYFNSEGTVIFSNEPDKYYYYQITAQIDFERLVRYRTATVTMHCQPFKYSATEQPITEDVSGTVSDEGTNLALENTAEAPFNTLNLKGNTEQQTYTGKNLLKPYSNPSPITGYSGLDATLNSDGSITLNGTATAEAWIEFGFAFQSGTQRQSTALYSLDSSSTYTLSSTVSGTRTGNCWLYVQIASSGTEKERVLGDSTSFTGADGIYRSWLRIASGASFTNVTIYPQLEKSSSATAWERYVGGTSSPNSLYPQPVQVVTGENVVKICGKNLFDGETINAWLRPNGTKVNSNGDRTSANYIAVLPNTTYTLHGTLSTYLKFTQFDSSKTAVSQQTTTSATTLTATTGATTAYIRIGWGNAASASDVMLELGSTATAYEPYQEQSYPLSLGSIELCKLTDDYQDYIFKNEDKWYKHKKINKYVFTGTTGTGGENWYFSGNSIKCNELNTVKGWPEMSSEYAYTGNLTTQLYSNYGTVAAAQRIYSGTANSVGLGSKDGGGGTTDSIYVSKGNFTALADWNAALAATPLICYYVLRTPVDEEITDGTLIEQLNDIYYHAHAYKGRTHISSSAATGNVPHIIAAEVGEDNESTITNAGNYLSKPKITVYGSGDISLYINDMHALQITLGDEGYITIDTAQMEAYKDTLDNLKNRLVIGDYSNAHLKPGANKVHFTGTVTKYVVENYSRWL